MLDIAKIVKQRINELNESEDYVQIDSEINKIVSKIAKDNSITRIPEDESKKIFINYRELSNRRKFVHYGPDYIIESNDLMTQLNNLKGDLKHIYKFEDWQITIEDLNEIGADQAYIKIGYNSPLVDIIIADIDDNEKIITEFMVKRGFALIRKIKEKFNNFISFGHLMYTPAQQENIRPILESNPDIVSLYHITPVKYIESIHTNGLVPRERKGEYGIYYPPRIYFSYNKTTAINYKAQLSNERKDGDYIICQVYLYQLPEDVELFYDPLFGKPFVYTTVAIKPELIINVDKI